MAPIRLLAFALMAILLTGGCVAQQRADDLQRLNRALEEQVVELQMQLEESRSRAAMLQRQLASRGDDEALTNALANAEGEIARLNAQLSQARSALADAENRLRQIPTIVDVVLPEAIDAELRRLAAQYPDLMSYDPQRGMIKLESDLTFALGSIEVSDPAKAALRRLATVLKRGEIANFEIRVIGHTDNVPVRNPANVQRFGDNWGLSAFRAISVKTVLQNDGVAPDRFMVGGYGEFHPIVPNGPRGAQQNRRVEIFIVPMTRPSVQPAATAAPATRTQPAQEPEDPTMFK